MSHRPTPGRRSVLRGSLAASAALTLPAALGAAPAFALSGRPKAGCGVQTGDVTADSGLVWVRSDRPARMIVETAATESFRNPRRWHGPLLGAGTDFTGTTRLHGLPAGEQIHYRVLLADPDDPRRTGEPVGGTFRTTPPGRRQGVRFLWSGDLAGQGWGINPDFGGYTIYKAMAKLDPDFFLCSGDNIYADGPLSATQALPDGSAWRNITTEEKSKVAETLAEYRGNFRYNLLDENLRRFNAQVPSIIQWDDHEVRNNWYPGEVITSADPRYTEKSIDVLAARARRAFSEYFPSRRSSRRTATAACTGSCGTVRCSMSSSWTCAPTATPTRPTTRPSTRRASSGGAVGVAQAGAVPVPRGVEGDRRGHAHRARRARHHGGPPNIEAVAQGDPGAPLGRELQIAELLRFIKHRRITGTVWLTADVHHTSAQHYQPSHAAFTDFEPFWEFVSGPLNAGAFPASALDGTFGPERVFVKAPTDSNVSPAGGYQFFGEVDIDGGSGELTVRLREQDGTVLFTQVLQPGRVGQ